MADINVDVNVSNGTNVEVDSPSKSINAIVNLPSPLSPTVTSPTFDTQACVVLPQGPQGPIGPSGVIGPSGAQGTASNINSLNPAFLYITGKDGIIVSSNNIDVIFISGNSGYFQSAVNSLTTNLQTTGGNLYTLLTNFSGNLDANYATNLQLYSTGSALDNKINSVSGYTNSQNIILSGYFEAENVIGYKANLTPEGYDNYHIQFPQALSSAPKSLVCTFQNTIDSIAYHFTIGSITNTGFDINFSDILLNNGYYLNIQIKK